MSRLSVSSQRAGGRNSFKYGRVSSNSYRALSVIISFLNSVGLQGVRAEGRGGWGGGAFVHVRQIGRASCRERV